MKLLSRVRGASSLGVERTLILHQAASFCEGLFKSLIAASNNTSSVLGSTSGDCQTAAAGKMLQYMKTIHDGLVKVLPDMNPRRVGRGIARMTHYLCEFSSTCGSPEAAKEKLAALDADKMFAFKCGVNQVRDILSQLPEQLVDDMESNVAMEGNCATIREHLSDFLHYFQPDTLSSQGAHNSTALCLLLASVTIVAASWFVLNAVSETLAQRRSENRLRPSRVYEASSQILKGTAAVLQATFCEGLFKSLIAASRNTESVFGPASGECQATDGTIVPYMRTIHNEIVNSIPQIPSVTVGRAISRMTECLCDMISHCDAHGYEAMDNKLRLLDPAKIPPLVCGVNQIRDILEKLPEELIEDMETTDALEGSCFFISNYLSNFILANFPRFTLSTQPSLESTQASLNSASLWIVFASMTVVAGTWYLINAVFESFGGKQEDQRLKKKSI